MAGIVVGIDGSEPSNRALVWAVEEALLRGAQLRVVHVWFEVFVEGRHGAPAAIERNAIEQAARELIDETLAATLDGHPELNFEIALVQGQPGSVLRDEAQTADLIVVGSHGRGGLADFLLGSVSQEVIRHSSCPAVVVH